MNVNECAVVVNAYPDGRCRPEIVHFLEDRNFPRHNIRYMVHQAHDRSASANNAVHLALSSGKEWCMFIESDVRPSHHTKLDSPYSVTCARCVTESPNAFADPTDFHAQMWWARASDIVTVQAPWFTWPEFVRGQVVVSECYCTTFRRRVIDAGLSIGWTGFVGHVPNPQRVGQDFICAKPKLVEQRPIL